MVSGKVTLSIPASSRRNARVRLINCHSNRCRRVFEVRSLPILSAIASWTGGSVRDSVKLAIAIFWELRFKATFIH